MSSSQGHQNTPPSLPKEVEDSVLVCYKSAGIGVFGMAMRWAGMPLEKIALYLNSSQVKKTGSGPSPFRQAVNLTFQEGALGPYRVVGPSSIVAWFLQYSVMGFAFQFFDHALSNAMGVKPVYYGQELMEPPSSSDSDSSSAGQTAKYALKTFLAPLLAGSVESRVANRAEVERYFGRAKFSAIESKLNWRALSRQCGPAFLSNVSRNVIMCNTTFILTPITYKLYFPQEKKSNTTLFWYGLGMNVFVGNTIAITQQALWGRSLDYCARNGGQNISYPKVIREGLSAEGTAAFFTPAKWFSRVLMNAPAQGVLPWFYNNVLPLGEDYVLKSAATIYHGLEVKNTMSSTASTAATAGGASHNHRLVPNTTMTEGNLQ
mmetsp:Transcript_6406/g.8660  ORF Transcript_6406/g.8660 Transcript_6406/m.8660 type:complete len:376 (-) Transcript_6406:542-1669(-)|eukprot:CAMPEP_0185740526 /NCGR_PEP_ID=MMETSP1171-20130828/37970_1 /TAXON_ID=374046 /ORGANISM="Helicotheca tamensis, Strain CCMP826" /LENGTH=375 /DNA_ID=CAMNT_0028412395 /DNA_START=418 /DNA_END=1545 /DNA_ORIENTATION=-